MKMGLTTVEVRRLKKARNRLLRRRKLIRAIFHSKKEEKAVIGLNKDLGR